MLRRAALLEIPCAWISDVSGLLVALQVRNAAWDTATPWQRRQMAEFRWGAQLDRGRGVVRVPRNFDYTPYLAPTAAPDSTLLDATSLGTAAPGLVLGEQVRLRDYQLAYFEQKVWPAEDAGLTDLDFRVPCGHGKSLMAIYRACALGRRTLVLVTTHALGQQFRRAVEWVAPTASVGVMEPGKKWAEWEVTIATYALLADTARFDEAFHAQFGHVVLDEWHKSGARTRYPILERTASRYRTFLTASFRRRDGLDKLLRPHAQRVLEMARQTPGAVVLPLLTAATLDLDALRNVGKKPLPQKRLEFGMEVLVQGPGEQPAWSGTILTVDEATGGVRVQARATGETCFFAGGEAHYYALGELSFARMDTALTELADRRALVRRVLQDLRAAGRTTLVLSRRTDPLYSLAEELTGLDATWAQGVVVSQKRAEQKKYAAAQGRTPAEQERYCVEEAQTILGIDKLAEEGLDIPRLDTLLLLHPLKDIEQAVGRILRLLPGKRPALVVYCCDEVNPYRGAWRQARQQFEELGHTMLQKNTWDGFMTAQEKRKAR